MSNKELFTNANKALAEGNYEEFIDYCAENIIWKNIGGNTYNGKLELISYIRSVYPTATFTTENVIQENDFVVELGKLVSEINGNSKTHSYCDVWSFKSERISQVTSFVI